MIGPEFVAAIFAIGLCSGYAIGYLIGRMDKLENKAEGEKQ